VSEAWEEILEDRRLLLDLARWLRKHDSTIFDPDSDDQYKAVLLLERLAEVIGDFINGYTIVAEVLRSDGRLLILGADQRTGTQYVHQYVVASMLQGETFWASGDYHHKAGAAWSAFKDRVSDDLMIFGDGEDSVWTRARSAPRRPG
jgi:hypothetical protein